MQALAWIFRVAIVLVLVWFAVRNGQEVEIRALPEQSWKAPLIFVMLVAFLAGVLIGLTAWLPTVVRQRREIGRLRKSATLPVPLPASVTDAPVPAEPAPAAGTARGIDGV
jgi:lipopolysaccharide assembly protein A